MYRAHRIISVGAVIIAALCVTLPQARGQSVPDSIREKTAFSSLFPRMSEARGYLEIGGNAGMISANADVVFPLRVFARVGLGLMPDVVRGSSGLSVDYVRMYPGIVLMLGYAIGAPWGDSTAWIDLAGGVFDHFPAETYPAVPLETSTSSTVGTLSLGVRWTPGAGPLFWRGSIVAFTNMHEWRGSIGIACGWSGGV